MYKKKISAILGPTNTGKTYTALKKLFNFNSGVIGFPLRLLARENYEFAKNEFGETNVALITGEEKIIPDNAKYFFCTVESIPDNKNFEFVAIDEIQMAADFERGFFFTEKLINKKGLIETLYIGSSSMENILRKIYPGIKVLKKPRLSKLSYCGYKNISRLPRRSAIIAFSILDVYEIANKIKQSFGGVSVVMGALSPEVRNAQVKLFEDGKVDHIVATDAIGLGLNLNIKNIFFSDIIKFDGIRKRYLTFDEIAQIAGRAGRFLNDGFFGVTGNLKSLNNELISFVENYKFTEIKKIYWRNSDLKFSSPNDLIRSLSKKAEKKYFMLKRNASDQRFLKILCNDKSVLSEIKFSNILKILWEICSIPDYSKDLDEFHSRFLKKVFFFLVRENSIPDSWIIMQLNQIKKKTNKISELNYKISQIRKWSFLSFKVDWIKNNKRFQNKIKKIENDLSIDLHNQLISEFIGEFKNFEISKEEKNEYANIIKINSLNKITLGKEEVAKIIGFSVKTYSGFRKDKNNFLNKIFNNSMKDVVKNYVEKFNHIEFDEVKFDPDGKIKWKGNLIGQFIKGKELTKPKIKIFYDEYFELFKENIEMKLIKFFEFMMEKKLSFFKKVEDIAKPSKFFRALEYSILENLGHCRKNSLDVYYNQLTKSEIEIFQKVGLKKGLIFFFFYSKDSNNFKQMLVNVYFKIKRRNFYDRDFYFVKSFFSSDNHKVLQKMGYYLIIIGKRKVLVNYEYIEKLEKKKRTFKSPINTKGFNLLEKLYFKHQRKFIFFD